MHLENVATRTWLLGSLAGLAVAIYGLALLGLGGRIAPYDATAASSAPLSVAPLGAAPTERLGPIDQYAAIAARPVFAVDRSPQPFRLVSEAPPSQAEAEVRLAGVLITPRMRLATLQTSRGDSLRLHEGGPEVGGWRLLALEPRSAVVEGPGGSRTLVLEIENSGLAAHGAGPSTVPTEAVNDVVRSEPAVPVPGITATPQTVPAPTSGTVGTTQERIEAIRRQIEERRRQLQQGQGGAPASSP